MLWPGDFELPVPLLIFYASLNPLSSFFQIGVCTKKLHQGGVAKNAAIPLQDVVEELAYTA